MLILRDVLKLKNDHFNMHAGSVLLNLVIFYSKLAETIENLKKMQCFLNYSRCIFGT